MNPLKATASAIALVGFGAVAAGCGKVSDDAHAARAPRPTSMGAGQTDSGKDPRVDGGTEKSPGSPPLGPPREDAGKSIAAPSPDASTPLVVPPPELTLIDRLGALHFELDIEAIAPPGCHSVFKLEWNGDGIAGSDATETRIFDAAGRLVVAELASTTASVRRRMKVTYDAAGRGIEYLFGTRGTGSLEPLLPENASATDDQALGTVVTAERGADGSITARVASTEPGSPPFVESVVFGKGGRFESRTRNDGMFPFVETVSYDSEGRPSVHRFDHATWGPVWASPIQFTYGDHTTFATFMAQGTDGLDSEQDRISFYYDNDGKPLETDFDAKDDGKLEEKATFTVSADGLTRTETTDVGLDGVADIVTEITSRTDGSPDRGTERNMLLGGRTYDDWNTQWAHRQVTPLCAPPQGQTSIALVYGSEGNLLSRMWSQEGYMGSDPKLEWTDSVKNDYSAGHPVTQRKQGDWATADGYKITEDSTSECTLSTTCAQPIPWSAPAVRCELGLGLQAVPDVYSSLPGFATSMRCLDPRPLSSNFLTYYPYSQRDILGY